MYGIVLSTRVCAAVSVSLYDVANSACCWAAGDHNTFPADGRSKRMKHDTSSIEHPYARGRASYAKHRTALLLLQLTRPYPPVDVSAHWILSISTLDLRSILEFS